MPAPSSPASLSISCTHCALHCGPGSVLNPKTAEILSDQLRKAEGAVEASICSSCMVVGGHHTEDCARIENPGGKVDLYLIECRRQDTNGRRLWWKANSAGYTFDVSKAGRYTEEKALGITRDGEDAAYPERLVMSESRMDEERFVPESADLGDPLAQKLVIS